MLNLFILEVRREEPVQYVAFVPINEMENNNDFHVVGNF